MNNAEAASLPRRRWVDMTSSEFAALPRDTVAVLPVAAIEQHGPHLPVAVDACINAAVIDRALELLTVGLPVTILPMQSVGKSNEHMAFPGTLSLSTEMVIRLWTEIGESVMRTGVRRLVLFNSHGGQGQIAQIVARDLRVRHGMLVVCANAYDLATPAGIFPEAELRHGIHGGSVETSLMLALRPDLVQMQHADNFIPLSVQLERDYKYLSPEGTTQFGWQTQDLHPAGVCGNALDADEHRGRDCLARLAQALATLLEEVHRFPISSLRGRQ